MAKVYAIEGPSEAKTEMDEMYQMLKGDFPEAKLEVNETSGDYGIEIDGAEAIMRIRKW